MSLDQRKYTFLAIGIGLFLFTVTTIVYYPGLNGPFVFDDLPNILLNPTLRNIEFTWDAFQAAMLSNDSGVLKRPIPMLSFALNAALTQFDVYYFKLTNLVIHIINGLLLGYITYQLLLRYKEAHSSTPTLSNTHLLLVTAAAICLWLIHPLNLTSVLYVVQRMNSLSTLFILIGLVNYTIARKQIIAGHKSGLAALVLLPLWMTLAALCKENGVLLPVYVILIELFFYRFRAASSTNQIFRWLFFAIIIFPIATGILILITNYDIFIGYSHHAFTAGQRIMTEARVLWFYLSMIFIPDISRMGLFHDDFILSAGILEPVTTLLSIAGIMLLIVISYFTRNRYPLIGFAILWFLLGHSIESSFLALDLVYEHRNYLPQFASILTFVFYALYPYSKLTQNSNNRYIQNAVIILFILLTAYGTHLRSEQWRSDITLAIQEVSSHPASPRANTYLAVTLDNRKQYNTATRYFVTAANLEPENPSNLLRLIHHLDNADRPVPSKMIGELGRLLGQQNLFAPDILLTFYPLLHDTTDHPKLNHALIIEFEKYIERKSANVPKNWLIYAYDKLSSVYQKSGDLGKALFYLQKCIKLDKNSSLYYLESAEILISLNKPGEAKKILDTLQSSNILITKADTKRFNNIFSKLK